MKLTSDSLPKQDLKYESSLGWMNSLVLMKEMIQIYFYYSQEITFAKFESLTDR